MLMALAAGNASPAIQRAAADLFGQLTSRKRGRPKRKIAGASEMPAIAHMVDYFRAQRASTGQDDSLKSALGDLTKLLTEEKGYAPSMETLRDYARKGSGSLIPDAINFARKVDAIARQLKEDGSQNPVDDALVLASRHPADPEDLFLTSFGESDNLLLIQVRQNFFLNKIRYRRGRRWRTREGNK
jgi:hypothetical protein